MIKPYLFALSLSVLGLFTSACRHDKEADPAPVVPATSSLKAENVSPAVGSKLSSTSTISADLTYALADNQLSDYGFEIFAQFETTSASTTIGASTTNNVKLTNRAGKVSISVPLGSVWNDTRLKHPVTAYFYLVNKNTPTSSSVIAKAGPFTFTE